MTGFGDLNLKCPLIWAISVLTGSLNFMHSSVEHGNVFITSEPVLNTLLLRSQLFKVSLA